MHTKGDSYRPGDWLADSTPHLRALRDQLLERLNSYNGAADWPIKDAADYFISRPGKLLRPLLTLLACEAAGGHANAAIEFACAVELVHCSSLIFDDLPCMDNSRMRREQPALHVRFGEAVAMLVGVYLLTEGFKTAAKADRGGSGSAIAILSSAIAPAGMIKGQLLDLIEHQNKSQIRELKTMPLFRAAVELGAYAARASDAHREALLQYSRRIGTAFQLKDDIIDGDAPQDLQKSLDKIIQEAREDVLNVFRHSATSASLAELASYVATR